MADVESSKFTFQLVPTKRFQAFESNEVKDLFIKWGMSDRTAVQMYTFDKYFSLYQKDMFLQDFFTDQNVVSTLKIFSSTNTPGPLGIKANKIIAEHLPCAITSMEFFDRLFEKGVVRESGAIKKCFDEFYEDFVISDELRKVLLMEESEVHPIYSESERQEFLFLVFKHICLGGQVCQYEDSITPYLDTAKSIYKDLISVHKDSETKKLKVGSVVFKISALDENGEMFYPSAELHEQSFAYMSVDLAKRHVFVWHHSWKT